MLYNGGTLPTLCIGYKYIARYNVRFLSRNSAIRKGQIAEKRITAAPSKRRALYAPPEEAFGRRRDINVNPIASAGHSRKKRALDTRSRQHVGFKDKSKARRRTEFKAEQDDWAVSPMEVAFSRPARPREPRVSTMEGVQRKSTAQSTARWPSKERRAEPSPDAERRNSRRRMVTDKEGFRPAEHDSDARERTRAAGRRGDDPVTAPFTLPFTTAASEFLYGQSSVIAALKANRRKLYKLYIHPRAHKQPDAGADVEKLARRMDVPIIRADERWLPAMDKVSQDRPHNGLILEASPLPKPPVVSLGVVPHTSISIPVTPIPHQSAEDVAINGSPTSIPRSSRGINPIVLLLDSILDPGNLGAIIRSAYFLGIDALAISVRTCAPITPAALKASAGAAEALPVLAVPGTAEFLDGSVRNGWKIAVAVTPDEHETKDRTGGALTILRRAGLRNAKETKLEVCDASSVVGRPLIIAVGGEGTGLRENIRRRAHYYVGIDPARDVFEVGVDSLNVSVAAALICQHFVAASGSTLKAGERTDGESMKDLW